MEDFESLLRPCLGAVERCVKFRIDSPQDAEDLLQETYLTAFLKLDTLKDPAQFKPWLLQIARNKCRDYYRRRQPESHVPLESVENYLTASRYGPLEAVRETLDTLSQKDQQLLKMTYYEKLSQQEIAQRLHIPLGTVKSRMYTAKRSFQSAYPYPPHLKGDFTMKKLPEYMPTYTITPSEQAPFSVKWEELQGWMIVPKLGETLSWGLYEGATGKRTEYTDMKVVGKAQVHGISGVEIHATQYDAENYYRTGSDKHIKRQFVAQLTDTHCRFLAESHVENGVRKCYTFLDGDPFLNNWGFGPDNCGNPTNLAPQGFLTRTGDVITGQQPDGLLDIVGRYTLELGGKCYDTICVMDIECFNDAVASETYLDQNGRTILWRRFNRNDWAYDHFGKLWSELLPDNQRLTISGRTYVHWYDCITDYIL